MMRRAVLCTAMGLVAALLAINPSAAATLPSVEPVMVTGCGTAISKPGGGTWECTFADNFDGTSLDRTKWHPQTNFATGGALPSQRSCHLDDPHNIAVAQGNLKLTVRRAPTLLTCQGKRAVFSSAQVSTYWKFSQQYGRFEARIMVHPTAGPIGGLQESFWLWPDDRYSKGMWPAAGEIDIAELYSRYNTLVVPYLHYTWNDNGGPKAGINTNNCPAQRGVYNTYTLTWSSTTLKIDVNGTTCLTNTSGDPAFQKRYIIALTQGLGVGANRYRWNTPIPATMNVDYVRVWR